MKWLKVTVICFTFCGLCCTMTTSEMEDFKNFLEKTSQLDQILVKKGVNPDTDYDDEDSISDDAWEESGKFEGDLILNDRQRRVIVQDVVEGLSRNGLRDTTKRWPDNELIYYIQKEHFTSDQVQAIQDGIDDLAQASCIKFRHYKKGDRDAVVIQGSRRGCFSQVGYQGGYQVLNLNGRHPPGRGCFRHGTIVHELLHSLGFYHMQSSPDRDDYIDVKWENIHQPARHNFRKYNTFSVSDFGVGYDYDSVLHYSRRAFSINGQDTLVPKQSGASIGQRLGLSDKDIQKLNKMYCDADSNNQEAVAADDEPIRKKEDKKENPKNKPFEGHGIGYHQGKTIVIKLPKVQTVKLSETPIFHVFDHFSTTPQAVSTQALEGFGAGQEIEDQYKLYLVEKDYSTTAIPYPQNENDSDKKQDDYDDSVHEPYPQNDNDSDKKHDDYDDSVHEPYPHNNNNSDKTQDDNDDSVHEPYPHSKNDSDKIHDDYGDSVHESYPHNKNDSDKKQDDFDDSVDEPYPHNKTDSDKKQNDFGGSVHDEYDYTTTSLYPKEKSHFDYYSNEVSVPSKASIQESVKNLENVEVEDTSPENLEKNNTGQISDIIVNEAFDRLGKIIKTHVYPSQTTDLDIYKTTTDYSKFYTSKGKSEPESVISKLDKTTGSTIFSNKNTNVSNTKKDEIKSSDDSGNEKFLKEKAKAEENFLKEKDKAVKIVSESPNSEENLKEFDAFYGTSLPLKKMFAVNDEKFVTPSAFTAFKKLANKHDYSGLYYPQKGDKKQKEKHALFGYLLPARNDWIDSENIKKDNEKYDREVYSYPPDSSREHVISSKLIQLEPDRPNAKEIFGRQSDGKAYSLFGVLVPLTKKWYRIDYDPHSHYYSIDERDSSEDYR